MKIFALILLTLPLFAQSTTEIDAIKSVLKTQEKLWNEGKIEAFMEYYEKSEDLKFIGKSGVTKGCAARLERY